MKRIPAAAGLGGGSSDAAAALVAANEGWRLGRSREELAAWAAELGSDVPFFLAGSSAVCRGRGERVEPVVEFGAMSFVVVYPPEGLSTAAVYGACRPAEEARSSRPLLEALKRGDWRQAGRRLWNRLQPAAEALSPWVGRLQRGVLAAGLPGAWNERKWHGVLWIISPCSSGAVERTAIAGKGARRGICRAKLPLSGSQTQGEQPWKSPRFA